MKLFGKIGITSFSKIESLKTSKLKTRMHKFSKEELVRYSRQLMLAEVGISGQEKIKNSKVLVIGAGGLGCPVLQYLCAAGVGTIGILDFDVIEPHNLHRQILYSTDDLGKSKAKVAAEKLRVQNPNVNCVVFDLMINIDNAKEVISLFDIIIDGSDNFETRYIVNDSCVELKKSLVYGTILRSQGQVAVFNFNSGKNLRDLYPEAPNPEDVPNCSEVGVIGVVPGMIGTMMAAFTLDIILEIFKSENTLHLVDLNKYSIVKLEF
jgi:molybdopterin-synthase adenylyltransferase